MTELGTHLGFTVCVDEMRDSFPEFCVVGSVHARASRSDSAFRRYARHLRHNKASSTESAASQMNQMKIVWSSILRAVHVHGRNHDAVLERHTSKREWRKHGWNG